MSCLEITIATISMLATVTIAITAVWQLPAMLRAQKQRATLDVCDRYDSDLIIVKSHRVLTSYYKNNAEVKETDLDEAYSTLMNYFDSVAIGIKQGLYLKKIADAHISRIVVKHINWSLDSKFSFHKKKDELNDSYEEIMALYEEWKR